MSRTTRSIRLSIALLAGSLYLASAEDGGSIFRTRCSPCHGDDGNGGERGPAISTRAALRSDGDLAQLIQAGLPGAGMPPTTLNASDSLALVAFVRTLRPPMARVERIDEGAIHGIVRNRSASALQVQGDDGKLRLYRRSSGSWRAVVPGRDWPTYNGDVGGNRHSPLDQITAANVARLRVAWIHPVTGSQRLEVTPVVVEGVMYITSVNEVQALDAGTGQRIWQYKRGRSPGLVGDASSGINRGVAISGDRLFLVTDNAHMLALNRMSGALLWDAQMAPPGQNYGATSAPLVAGDVVISGTSGGDEGARGFLAAYKVSTGERVWRFWTVPAPGEPLASTWKGSAIAHGCATTWLTGTFDAQLNLLYWTTGNPCPDYNGDERGGDNLYSDSVLALRGRANSSGTSNTRLTIFTIGMPNKRRFSSMRIGKGVLANS